MPDAIEAFFDELGRGHERLLKRTAATLRFDIEHDRGTDHWFLTIRQGKVRVSRDKGDAEAVFRTDKAFFERMVRGSAKPMPAWLRNDVICDGSFRHFALLERLFPGPPGAHHPRSFARDREGRR